MRSIFSVAAVYGGILGSVSFSVEPLFGSSYLSTWGQAEIDEMRQREAKKRISRIVYERVVGKEYSTPLNNTVNGTNLIAKAVFEPAASKVDLQFWQGEHKKVEPDFSLSLNYGATPGWQDLQYPGDLRHLRSVRIHTWITLESSLLSLGFVKHVMRRKAIKSFNEKFGDVLKAGKDDFKEMTFIPNGDRHGTDHIVMTIGGKLFRMYPERFVEEKH
ncbi:hypothetical protein FOZ63_026523 [Perkinsus olseni]|uniref:Uncharacterized protein n=1 Tax=Perkinsus olseni TaxID=32597 RepID=A0A7J6SPI2_PEROL|nr:hypothetical protein FOZ63_026523 [Perkinsus olseni]